MRIAEIQVQAYGKEPRSFSLLLEITSNKIKTPKNLKEAIRAACTEYVTTEQGKKIYNYNHKHFNWDDFKTSSLPESLCAKYGFRKIPVPKTEMNFIVNWDDELPNEK